MVPLTNISFYYEVLAIVAFIIITALYATNACNWKRDFKHEKRSSELYSYNEPNGPSYWKTKYEESRGNLQSPINICLTNATVVCVDIDASLCFSEEYNITPNEMSIYNNGHSVTIYARWDNGIRPIVMGGPCKDKYQFLNARFRWGPNDHEGSEHTINHKSYAMELQAVHTKTDKCYDSLSGAALDNAVLIITYLYEISPVENPYLKTLVNSLVKIENPNGCVNIEPIPLFFFMPSFVCNYIYYNGSLTHPPCTEGVQWIVQPEPLGISSYQVALFRRLRSFCDILDMNRRPVQSLNGRELIFYE
ncbi:hypothetical protein RN001_005105 [Aquatica leii]|uniref:Alpha-carbonic anhydrase domain-containing protein n=1 Tax=Aquatica leii TaxID=1421715 RepID=A0AAN7PFJ7_9COLE|nr:hypothetical protein RN001_005105 [Aquatica leii]